MACTIQDFRDRFPEFEDDTEYSDSRIQLFLDDTVLIYLGDDEDRWKGKYDVAHCYAAAHLLSRATNTEAGNTSAKAGPVSSKAAGGVSVSYSANAKDRSDGDDFWMSTSYGQQFVAIRNMCFAGIRVATLTEVSLNG